MQTRDMTQGNPVKLILWFAAPLFIGNIFQQIYSIVDTMVAGYNLGDMAIAAIGGTSSLYGLLINFASGLNSGYGIVVSRVFGSKNQAGMKRAISTMLVLNLSITIVLTVLSLLCLQPLMVLMNVPDSIFMDAFSYISVILGGMLATIVYNMFAGILRAVGNSRTPLYFLIIGCVVNLGLDVLFIALLKWGVRGAAVATVIAQSLCAVLAGLCIFRRYRELLPGREDFRIDKPILLEMASSGFAMAVMLCVVDIGSVVYQRSINDLGEMLIVAHTTARRIIGILMMPLASIATAYSTFVGQNWGAGKYGRVHTSLKKIMAMEAGWGGLSGSLIFLFGGLAVRALTGTTDPAVIDNAVLSLRLHFICFPALGILLVLRTALQAMGRKVVPVISSGFELAVKVVAGVWLIPMFGYICVCLAEPVIWTLCTVFLVTVLFIQKPFQQHSEVDETVRINRIML